MKKFFLCLFLYVYLPIPLQAVEYEKFDLSDINAINKIVKEFKVEHKSYKNRLRADKDFDEFAEFYNEFVEVQNSLNRIESNPDEKSLKKQLHKYTKAYNTYGLNVQFDEGEFFIVKNHRYVYKNFAPYLTSPKKDLLKFEVRFDKRMVYDGRYVVSRKKIIEAIRFYEKFIEKYPDYSKKHQLYEVLKHYKNDLKHYPDVIY